MVGAIFARLVILVFGLIYPAYASFKGVRSKSIKEYVKWMMYWIVFALFTCVETFTDIMLSWFPFYYEIKIFIVLWLLMPATRGSSILYRKFVHPALMKREQEIDDYINQAKDKGYTAVLQLGSKGVNYATNVIMQTAIKAFNPQQLPSMMRLSQSDNTIASAPHNSRRTYSVSDVTDSGGDFPQVDIPSMATGSARVRRSHSADSALNKASATTRSQTNTRNHSVIYEIDSEEEEQLLADVQAAIEQNQFSLSDTVDGTSSRSAKGRACSVEVGGFAKESSVETEDGSARSRVVPKRKTTTSTTARSSTRKATSTTTKTTAATRGRKKVRKDSESMDVDIV